MRAGLWLAAGGAIALYGLVMADGYDLRVLTLAGAYAIMVIGYQFVFGHAGALSLAQGAFFGVGAYAGALSGLKLGLGFLPGLAIAILAAIALAALIALPVRRLQSHYFALATLGIAQIVLIGAVNWEGLTGGGDGIPLARGFDLFGLAVPRGVASFVFVWVGVAGAALLAVRLLRGRARARHTIAREAPLAAAACGIDAARLRYTALLASAGFAGAAGALYVPVVRVISPEVTGFEVMIACLAMAVIGGRTSIAGAIAGALLLIHLPEWFRFLQGYDLIGYGAVLLLAVVVAPQGLAGLARDLLGRYRHPAAPSLPTPRPAPIRRGAPGRPVLRFESVAKSFGGVTALDSVSLSLEPASILGLIGPNGSGKTTLANLATGQVRALGGSITIDGTNVSAWPAFRIARLGVGRSFQTPALAGELSALANVAGARAEQSPENEREDSAVALACLERMGVADRANDPCRSLPHGLRRRVEIARALALEPKLLVLDEPAAGLSEAEQADLARRLAGIRDAGAGILVIEHNIGFLMGLADRLACLQSGKLIAEGSPEEVRANELVIAAYIGVDALDNSGNVP